MKSLNDYFDKVYCINIKEAEDRKASIEKLAEEFNFEVNWLEASTPKNTHIPSHSKIMPGEFCCAVSHIRLWDRIKKDNPKRGLILEDDAIPTDPDNAFDILDKIGDKFLDTSVDLAYLGLNYLSVGKMIEIEKPLYKISRAYTTHAYSPSVNFLKSIHKTLNLDTFYKNPACAIDTALVRLMPNYNCMAVKPSIFLQDAGFSYIHSKYKDFRNQL